MVGLGAWGSVQYTLTIWDMTYGNILLLICLQRRSIHGRNWWLCTILRSAWQSKYQLSTCVTNALMQLTGTKVHLHVRLHSLWSALVFFLKLILLVPFTNRIDFFKSNSLIFVIRFNYSPENINSTRTHQSSTLHPTSSRTCPINQIDFVDVWGNVTCTRIVIHMDGPLENT